MDRIDDIPGFPLARPDDGPPPAYLRLRQQAALNAVRMPDGNTAWLAARYDDVRALLADDRLSNDPRRPGYPQLNPSRPIMASTTGVTPILFTEKPDHARFRRTLNGEFTHSRMKALEPVIVEVVDGLIDAMVAQGSPVDLVRALALPVPTTIILRMLGIAYAEHGFFQERANTIISTGVPQEATRQAQADIRSRFHEIFQDKARRPDFDDDIMGRMLRDHILPGELSFEEGCMLCQSLVIAGHETTANMIALGTLSLLRHPEIFARLRDGADPAYVARVVEEMLRFWTTVHLVGMRAATGDIALDGHTIKAGEGVLPQILAANHDPAVFPDPDRFDVEREARSPHLAFGFGMHQCVGQALARRELNAVFATLPRRIPTLRLALPEAELRFTRDMLSHGLIELPVAW